LSGAYSDAPADGSTAVGYHWSAVRSGGMTAAIRRTLSMRSEVDRMLAQHVEVAALAAYKTWDLEADRDEKNALAAFAAHNDGAWASE
jgi:hypothetical protein